jgi:hypothetical protein
MPASHWDGVHFVQQAKQKDTVHKVLQTLNSPENLRSERADELCVGWLVPSLPTTHAGH